MIVQAFKYTRRPFHQVTALKCIVNAPGNASMSFAYTYIWIVSFGYIRTQFINIILGHGAFCLQ